MNNADSTAFLNYTTRKKTMQKVVHIMLKNETLKPQGWGIVKNKKAPIVSNKRLKNELC